MKAIKSIREFFKEYFFRILSGIKNFLSLNPSDQVLFRSCSVALSAAADCPFIIHPASFCSGLPVRPVACCFLTESSCKAATLL